MVDRNFSRSGSGPSFVSDDVHKGTDREYSLASSWWTISRWSGKLMLLKDALPFAEQFQEVNEWRFFLLFQCGKCCKRLRTPGGKAWHHAMAHEKVQSLCR